ncbi:MAG: co-chaperone GroES [Patescibacteria group bacterium]
MNKKIIPLGDRVLVKPFSERDLMKGDGKKKLNDFILPESLTKEKSAQGKVIAVGETKKIKVGETVLFSKYSYDEVENDGEELYLIKEENILAVIKN